MAHWKIKALVALCRGLIHQKFSMDNCRIFVIGNPLRTSSSRTVSLLPMCVYSLLSCYDLIDKKWNYFPQVKCVLSLLVTGEWHSLSLAWPMCLLLYFCSSVQLQSVALVGTWCPAGVKSPQLVMLVNFLISSLFFQIEDHGHLGLSK